MTEWRGPDALNNGDLAHNFWDLVGEPAKSSELQVGDVATIEVTHNGKQVSHRLVQVVECMKSDAGDAQIRFEDVPPGQTVTHSGVVIVVPT